MDARDEIKERLSIEDVVGRYVDLKRSGSTLKGLCPFHQEKTPSFHVTPSRGTFHCFGCQRGGDIFTFMMEIERLQFPEALKLLADQAGVRLPDRQGPAASLKGRLFDANKAAAEFFTETLKGGPGERARAYLTTRSFGADAVDLFGLGYAPAARDLLVQHLRSKGFDDASVLGAGLAMQDDVGGTPRDRFRGRLMFPIRDASGKISGFGGRALDEDQQPKYLNSSQTEIFDKSSVLFGIHLAAETIRKEKRAVLVEGYLDAVRAHLAGYRFTVASLGTAVTTHQLASLSRSAQRVVLALDPDPAGQSAAARTALTALAEVTRNRERRPGAVGAVDLLVARLPDNRDPDELIDEEPELWEAAIDAAIPAFDFYFEQTLQSLDRSSDAWRQEAIDRLLPVIQQFATSAGWQALWMQRLSQETEIDVRALERSIPSSRAPARPRAAPEKQNPEESVVGATTTRALAADPAIGIERALLALLLHVVVVPEEAEEQLVNVTLERPEHQAALRSLLDWSGTGNYDYEMMRETLPEGVRELADELRELDVPLPEDDKISVAVALHLARLRQFRLQSELERIRQLLPELAEEDKPAAMARLAALTADKFSLDETLEALSRLVLRSSTIGAA